MRRFGSDVDAPGNEQSMKHPVGERLAVDQDAVAVEDDQGRRRHSIGHPPFAIVAILRSNRFAVREAPSLATLVSA